MESRAKAVAYYVGVLGMSEGEDGSVGYDGYGRQCRLRFVEKGSPVDHGKAFGRLATVTAESIPAVHSRAVASGMGSVINTPIVLDTPGKPSVEVTILADPDGYELCFVGEEFYALAVPDGNKVDWEKRKEEGAKD